CSSDLIDASHFTTDGYRQHSKAERDQTMVKLTYRPSEDGKLTFIANSFKQTAEDPQGQTWAGYLANPRSVAAPALTYNTRKSLDHMQGGLTYEHRFGDHSVLVSAYAGQRSTLAFQSIPKATQTASTSHSGGVIDFDRDFAGASARWIGRFQLAGGKLTTTAGVEYEQAIDNRRGYENFIGTTLGVKGALRRAEEDRVATFDQYAQAEWQGERWTFSGGLRHSQVSFNVKDAFLSNGDGGGNVSYEKTTPTVAAMYRLTPSVNVYASAARGFEAPTFNELFYSGPSYSFSYNLKPSTSTHYETGLKAFVGSSSRFDLAVFQIETKDELVVDSADSGRTSYRNAGQTLRRGIETALDSRWANNLSSRVAYTYLDARYDQPFTSSSGVISADNRLPGVAAHTLFGELAWKHPASGFHAAVEGIAKSKVYVEDTNAKQAAPGYAIANLRFGVDRQYGAVNLRTFLRFDNIFDRQYVGSVIVGDGNSRYYEAAPGRTWLAGVSARYSF
ncbi:MAG: TonB-dependent receptor, partial [Azonexaceae bacterium]|nr:TonB-dependent receptor [Azonexaceae bacterium]